jgi:hypothetical protein
MASLSSMARHSVSVPSAASAQHESDPAGQRQRVDMLHPETQHAEFRRKVDRPQSTASSPDADASRIRRGASSRLPPTSSRI